MAKRKNRAATEQELGLITDIQPDARMNDHHDQHSNANKAIVDLYQALDIDVDGTGDLVLGADFGNNVPDVAGQAGKVLATDGTDYGWHYVDSEHIALSNAPGSPFGISDDPDYATATTQAQANALFVRYISENEEAVKELALALGLELEVDVDGNITINVDPNGTNPSLDDKFDANDAAGDAPANLTNAKDMEDAIESNKADIDNLVVNLGGSVDIDGNITIDNIDALPDQSGQDGKFLTTDGTDASWVDADVFPKGTSSYADAQDVEDAIVAITGLEVLAFQGNVSDAVSLPGGAEEGDVYLVEDVSEFHVMTSDGWKFLGKLGISAAELAQLQSDIAGKYEAGVGPLDYADATVLGQAVKANEGSISENATNINNLAAELNLVINPDGSIEIIGGGQVPDLSDLEQGIADNATAIDGKFDIGTGTTNLNDATTMEAAIDANTENIGKLVTGLGGNIDSIDVDALPDQSGQGGKFLTTDGSDASWGDVPSDDTKFDKGTTTYNNAGDAQAAIEAIEGLPSGGSDGDVLTISGTDATWSDPASNPALKGEKGDDGDSAFEVWQGSNPGGTEAEYLEAIKGEKGDKGDGYTGGTYDASTGVVTFNSNDGLGFSTGDLRGADGADGTGVHILGSYDTEAELLAGSPTGNPGDAYLVQGDLYVWDEDNSQWLNVGRIQGPDGPAGADGDGWTGGTYDASTGIVTFTSDDGLGFSTTDLRGGEGAKGAGFTGGTYDDSTGVVTFTSDDGLGFDTGDLRGSAGAAGADGDSAYQVWLNEGNTGSEQDFLNSLKGEDYDQTALDGKFDHGGTSYVDAKAMEEAIKTNKDAIAEIQTKGYDDTEVRGLISDNKTAIETNATAIDGKFDKGATTYSDAKAMQDAIEGIVVPDVSGFVTETELNTALDGKADEPHTHDDLAAGDHDHDADYSDINHNHDNEYQPKGDYATNTDLDDLEGRVSTNEGDISTIQTEQGEQNTKIDANTTKNTEQDGKIGALETANQSLQNKVDALENAIISAQYNISIATNPREGFVSVGDETPSSVVMLTFNAKDANGTTHNFDQIKEEDVVTVSTATGVGSYTIASDPSGGFFSVVFISGNGKFADDDLADVVVSPAFDPDDYALISYVDAQDATKFAKGTTGPTTLTTAELMEKAIDDNAEEVAKKYDAGDVPNGEARTYADAYALEQAVLQNAEDLANLDIPEGQNVTVSEDLPTASDGDNGDWWIYKSPPVFTDFGNYYFKRAADTPGNGFIQCLAPGGPPEMSSMTSIQFHDTNYDSKENDFTYAFAVGSEIQLNASGDIGTYEVLAKAQGSEEHQTQLDIQWVGGDSKQIYLGQMLHLTGYVDEPSNTLFYKDNDEWLQIGDGSDGGGSNAELEAKVNSLHAEVDDHEVRIKALEDETFLTLNDLDGLAQQSDLDDLAAEVATKATLMHLTQDEYDALLAAGSVDENTLYVVT